MPGYFSELAITGASPNEFIEVAVPTGTDTSGYSIVHYMSDGTVYQTYTLGNVESVASGHDVYTLDETSGQGFDVTAASDEMGNVYPDDAFALVDGSGTVVQFISFYGNTITATEGAANGLTSTEIGTHGQGQSLQSDNGGSSYYVQSSPNRDSIPCFAAGTQILTASGYRPVEDLRIGDMIETVDHELQPIRWIRSYHADLSDTKDDQKPVKIAANALGPSCPMSELTVSPQHRIVIGNTTQVLLTGQNQCLAPAKALTSIIGIDHVTHANTIQYVHFALDQHEVVWAEGTQVESLYLSKTVLSALSNLQQSALWPLAQRHQKQAGLRRPFLTVSAARRLACPDRELV